MKEHPPKWADRFLEWYCHPELLEEIQGDAYELFYRIAKQNKLKAKLSFIWNVLRFFRLKNIRRRSKNYYSNIITISMLKNYFKTGWRNLMHKKAFSLINIFGLAIGLTSFLLIASFVYDELSYDKYAAQYKNIYRVGLRFQQNGGVDDYPHVDVAVAAGMKSTFPEIIESARMTGLLTDYIKHEGTSIKEEALVLADSNILKMFSIPLLEGNVDNALTEPNSIVISKAFARKYFGDKSPMGEMLTFNRNGLLKVTGIFDKIPEHSHFHSNAFISLTTGPSTTRRQTWSNVGYYSYLLLNEHADAARLEAKFPSLVEKYVVPEVQEDMGISFAEAQKSVNSWKFYLIPISQIHLYSHTKYEMEPNGDINNVYIFGGLAIFILLLACVNFMNLSTASSAKRSKEIGMRKVLGSYRNQLVVQFLVESMILAMIALTFALLFVFALLPIFNQLTGKHIDLTFFLSPQIFTIILALGVIVGIMAGIYPAVFLSSFPTLRVLKSSSTGGPRRGGLRSTLVVFQFTISTALIIATIIAYQQLHFMQNIKIGYDKEQILVIENAGALQKNQIVFKEKLKQDHRVVNTSNATIPIGNASSFGGTEIAAKESIASNIHTHIFTMDYDYIPTLGLEILVGRNFSTEFPSDSLGTNVVINETAMRDLGWNKDNVIGSTIVRSAQVQYQVIGVVKDFHYTSAKDKIAPLVIVYRGFSQATLVKVKTAELTSFIRDLSQQWKAFNVDVPFNYYFLDERFNSLYKAEQTTEQIFMVFMVIAVLIASLGLYGLSTYSAEQRTKEIGIRKVLGSSVKQIVFLQSKEFLILVLIAIVVASPLSWYTMNQWLQNFGYRIEINIWVILLAGVAALVIALLTVSFQALKAAVNNPVKSLRGE
jgi:putative ABC transport system permease protein